MACTTSAARWADSRHCRLRITSSPAGALRMGVTACTATPLISSSSSYIWMSATEAPVANGIDADVPGSTVLTAPQADAKDSKQMFLADRDGDYLGGRLKHERGERKGRRFDDAALDGARALNRSEIVMRHRLRA
jgi:hypothetical protein